jgi:hypothetical protein
LGCVIEPAFYGRGKAIRGRTGSSLREREFLPVLIVQLGTIVLFVANWREY